MPKEDLEKLEEEPELSDEMLQEYEPESFEPEGMDEKTSARVEPKSQSMSNFISSLSGKIPKLSFTSNKKRIISVFILIYLVFGIALVYLLFFNTGLTLVQQVDESVLNKVFVKNDSIHIIKKIQISYLNPEGSKVTFQEIPALSPSNTADVDISKIEFQKFQLFAEAPFHSPVNQTIAMNESKKATNLKSTILASKVAFISLAYELKMELCNNSKADLADVAIEERHDTSYFKEVPRKDVFDLKAGKCLSKDYSFMPIAEGQTTMYFNILADNTAETQKIEIAIQR